MNAPIPPEVLGHPNITLWLSIVTLILIPLLGWFLKRWIGSLEIAIKNSVTVDACKEIRANCLRVQAEFFRSNFTSAAAFDKETSFLCGETKTISDRLLQMHQAMIQAHGSIYEEIKRNREKVVDEINCIKRDINTSQAQMRTDITTQVSQMNAAMIDHLASHAKLGGSGR